MQTLSDVLWCGWVVDVKMLSLLPRIYYTSASSLQSTGCSPRLAHPPTATVGESLGLLGFLVLSSASPRSGRTGGNTSQLKNKSNNGQTEEDEVTATPIPAAHLTDPRISNNRPTTQLRRKATNLVASHLFLFRP